MVKSRNADNPGHAHFQAWDTMYLSTIIKRFFSVILITIILLPIASKSIVGKIPQTLPLGAVMMYNSKDGTVHEVGKTPTYDNAWGSWGINNIHAYYLTDHSCKSITEYDIINQSYNYYNINTCQFIVTQHGIVYSSNNSLFITNNNRTNQLFSFQDDLRFSFFSDFNNRYILVALKSTATSSEDIFVQSIIDLINGSEMFRRNGKIFLSGNEIIYKNNSSWIIRNLLDNNTFEIRDDFSPARLLYLNQQYYFTYDGSKLKMIDRDNYQLYTIEAIGLQSMTINYSEIIIGHRLNSPSSSYISGYNFATNETFIIDKSGDYWFAGPIIRDGSYIFWLYSHPLKEDSELQLSFVSLGLVILTYAIPSTYYYYKKAAARRIEKDTIKTPRAQR